MKEKLKKILNDIFTYRIITYNKISFDNKYINIKNILN